MPLFGKTKGKSAKFDYYLLLHSLSPFPANHKGVYIIWQRGSAKKGQTRAVGPTSEGVGRSWATYQFDEAFHVSCTLNQSPKGQGIAGPIFEKKWLILAIMDGDKGSKEPLGRVVINLADYAAEDDSATMSFTVAANNAISADVGECKMLITLGCRSMGKAPMTLGGKTLQQTSSYDKSSVASSEYSDEESEASELSQLTSQPMVKPLGRIPEIETTRRGQKDERYGGDGFRVHDDDALDQKPSMQQRQSVTEPAPRPAESGSDPDSEDEFLAQAVAAMDGKRPMPVAPSVTGQQSLQGRRAPQPSVIGIPSIGDSISAAPALPRAQPPSPFDKPQAAAPTKAGPIFALKPEGRPELKAEPIAPKRSVKADSGGGGPPEPQVPRAPEVAPSASKRELKSRTSSRLNEAGGASLPRRVSRLVSQFEPGADAASVPLRTAGSLEKRGSQQEGLGGVSTSGRLAEVPSNPFLGEGPEGSPRRRDLPMDEEEAEGLDLSNDRLNRGPSARRLASAGTDASQSRTDSPRRRKLEASRQEARNGEEEGGDRSLGVVLPSGLVSIKKRPLVSAPIEANAADSPLKTSTPGKHWLDEPEDLGVESSPGSSPSPTPRPAYQEVAPAPLRRAAGDPPVWSGPIPSARSILNNRQPAGSATASHDEEFSGAVSPSPFDDRQDDKSMPPSPPSPASSATNPFLVSRPVQQTPEREPPRSLPPSPKKELPPRSDLPPPPAKERELPSRTKMQIPVIQAAAAPQAVVQSSPLRPIAQPPSIDPHVVDPPRVIDAPRVIDPPRVDAARANPPGVVDPPRIEPHSMPEASPSNGNLYSGGPLSSAQTNGDPQALEVLTRELRAVAALEASVYLARSGKSRGVRASSKARNVHAPARRLARTTISLGPEEGIIFGLRAIRAIEAAADGSSDVAGRAYWWSNCIQLRWMLWAMCHGGGPIEEGDVTADPDTDEFKWVMEVLVPPLRELECHIFQQLFQHLWSFVLMEGATADQLPGAQAKHWIIPPSREEEAVQRWIDAFQTAHRALLPASSSVTSGHVSLLKHKILTALMRRLDAAIFERMVGGGDSGGTMARRDAFSAPWNGRKEAGSNADINLPLDSRLLPFDSGGMLTFGVGVNLKMAATRWTNWAADIGLRNDKGSPEEGYLLFPRLRATADLLMMPKEVLTDRAIRSEVVPGLPLRVICELLSRFQPDDLAREPLPPGLLAALQNETPPAEESPSPDTSNMTGYEPPSEAALLADGLIEPVSLEMDDESEDELETLVEMYDPDKQGHTTERFGLLRELWASAR